MNDFSKADLLEAVCRMGLRPYLSSSPQILLLSARVPKSKAIPGFQFPKSQIPQQTDPIFVCSRCFELTQTRAAHSTPARCRPLTRTAAHPLQPVSHRRSRCRRARMSGAALCAALTELGFDGEDPLDADALEWPFQYEEARPLLAWICSCLRPSNVLSPSHLAQ